MKQLKILRSQAYIDNCILKKMEEMTASSMCISDTLKSLRAKLRFDAFVVQLYPTSSLHIYTACSLGHYTNKISLCLQYADWTIKIYQVEKN
jgi:hypothetical protein